jgi:phosphopantetheinyl transferase
MTRKYDRINTWFIILSHYLNICEIEYYNSLSFTKQKEWLLGRITAKDAIRSAIMEDTNKISHPASFTIINDSTGKPVVSSNMYNKIHLSISHKKDCAVAYASLDKEVGIDIEEIKEREQGFIDLVLSDSEKFLLDQFQDKNEWITRFWAAKEAYGKYIGHGLNGNPKGITVSSINEEILIVGDIQIKTAKYENFIIGYTI